MKRITILLFALVFGFGCLHASGQEPKQKEKSKTEASLNQEEKKAAKKASKEAKKQKKEPKKGNAYGKNKEAEGKEFGATRSKDASKGKNK